jgi:hypothetical protein
MVNYDSHLKEIAKEVNSMRPLNERFKRVGLRITQRITPENIIETIRNNRGHLEQNRFACGAGYFIRSQGDSYVIMTYSRDTFLSIDLGRVISGETTLPTPAKQWGIPKSKLAQYL